jgi:hypothetical protein
MNILTTEQNLVSGDIGSPKKLLDTKTSLKMFDYPADNEIETGSIKKNRILSKISQEKNKNKFFNTKSIKLSKRNTLNKEKLETEQTEGNENNLMNFNLCKPDGTISLISDYKNPEKSKDSCAASFQSHSIDFYKNDLVFNGADIAFHKRLSLSSVNDNNLLNCFEEDKENSQYLDIQVNENVLQKVNNSENPKAKEEDKVQLSPPIQEKKIVTFNYATPEILFNNESYKRKSVLSLTNPIEPKKPTRKLATSEFNS